MPYIQALPDQPLFHYHITTPSNPDSLPPLILIHGLGSSQNFYQPSLPSLSDYRCISLDLPGSARSPLPLKTPLSIPFLASSIVGLLDALNIPKAVFVGHSVGGLIAATIAADPRYKDRVVGLVGIGAVLPGDDVKEVFEKRKATVEKEGVEVLADSVPLAATAIQATPLHRAFIRELILGQTQEGYASMCNVIATAERPNYSAIRAPTLLILGDEDESVPVAKGAETMKLMGGPGEGKQAKRWELLKRVGHWHCVEDGQRVGSLIAAFVKDIVANEQD